MKKRFGITAAAALTSCIMIFSGCAGCAGCNGQSKNIAALNSNWYANTSYKKIQPAFTEGTEGATKEVLTYKVTFDKSSAGNSKYSVSYADGTYKTEFYAAKFDRETLCAPEFKGEYPVDLIAYCYKTELDLPSVTFTVGKESKTCDGEKKVTECWFLSVEDYLQPLYSKVAVKSTTPANLSVDSLAEAYKELDYVYTTYYDYTGNTAKTVINDGKKEETKKRDLSKAENTLFDVASLDIAVRASKLSANLSQVVTLYSPASGAEPHGFSGSDTALGSAEKDIKTLLAGKDLYKAAKDEDGKEKPLGTVAVSVLYGGTLSGVSQTYWFASIDNPVNNTGRATMLRMLTPLPYSLGALDYTLQEITDTVC